jgi:bilirubin oxidase
MIGRNSRVVSLNEEESAIVDADGNLFPPNGPGDPNNPAGPTAALLGTLNPDGTGNPLLWADDVTENPQLGTTETWEIHNFTMDAHPIHIHQVQFQVVGRGAGGTQAPEPEEMGFKDTVIAYPGEITSVQARFDIPGRFVWHCHIVEHEDNEMMRPFEVGLGKS